MTRQEEKVYSAKYLLEDLNHEQGWQRMSEITGLPLGVVVEIFNTIFDNQNPENTLEDQ